MARINQTKRKDDTFVWSPNGASWSPASGAFPTIAADGDGIVGEDGAGWAYIATDSGIVGGVEYLVGDIIVSKVDTPSSSSSSDWSLFPAKENQGVTLVTAAAHGFSPIPQWGFWPVYYNGVNWLVADNGADATVATAFVVAIPDANTLVMTTNYVVQKIAHGRVAGTPLYLDIAGGLTATKPNRAQKLALPVDSDTILISIDAAEQVIPTAGVHTEVIASGAWVLNGSNYEYTISAATLATSSVLSIAEVQVWEDDLAGNLTRTTPQAVTNSAGNLTLSVSAIPDERFNAVVYVFADSITTSNTSYTQDFNETTDWGAAAAGIYTITIPAATHGVVGPKGVTLWEDPDGTFPVGDKQVTTAASVVIESDDDVRLEVLETPDGRFPGSVYIF